MSQHSLPCLAALVAEPQRICHHGTLLFYPAHLLLPFIFLLLSISVEIAEARGSIRLDVAIQLVLFLALYLTTVVAIWLPDWNPNILKIEVNFALIALVRVFVV